MPGRINENAQILWGNIVHGMCCSLDVAAEPAVPDLNLLGDEATERALSDARGGGWMCTLGKNLRLLVSRIAARLE